MKIYLDLLPMQKKQEIKRKKIFGIILHEEFLFLSPIIVLIFILLNIYYVLTLQKDSSAAANQRKQSQDNYQQMNIYEEKFKQVNTLGQELVEIQSGHMYWQQPLQELSNIMPEGIYLSNISTKNYTIFLIGKARTREDLLGFKDKLDSSECFQDINVPLSNLVVKNDVDFQIDLTITEDCLKKK